MVEMVQRDDGSILLVETYVDDGIGPFTEMRRSVVGPEDAWRQWCAFDDVTKDPELLQAKRDALACLLDDPWIALIPALGQYGRFGSESIPKREG